MASKSRGNNYSRLEAAKRFRAALRGAFTTPPVKRKPSKKKAAPRASSASE
jgi:hypothetical protein